LTFVRNGQEATAKEAAAHMRQKWDYFRQKIKTPEDFIKLAATKSELSGKLYLVRFKDGKESPAGEWLAKVLAEYRKKSSL
jgi:FPC/CPF motif-containing protein YcgG